MTDISEKEFYIENDGLRYHAKLNMPEGKDRCPLCIVFHGFTGHMEERHITAVSDVLTSVGIASLRVEMYGHGKSSGEFRDHTLFKWVTGGLAVIDYALGLDFVTDLFLAGHSQGGLLVMLLAGMCAGKIRALIPLSPAWMIPEKAREGTILGVNFDPKIIPEEIRSDNWTLDGNYIRTARMLHPEEAIAGYDGPVLIVHGDEDESVPVEYGEKAAKLYKNAELVIIRGDNHCYDRHLEEMKKAVKEFTEQTVFL